MYLGSSSSMTDVASKISSANGQDLSACNRRKCMRITHVDWMERLCLMAGLFKEWVPRDLFGPSRCRVRFSMMMVHAPGIYVGLLLGRELTWREAILKVWGQMSPWARLQIMGLDSKNADLRATTSQIRSCTLVSRQHFRSGPAKQYQQILEDWHIGMYYSIPA